MDSVEAMAVAMAGGAILLAIVIVLFMPQLGGDPRNAANGPTTDGD